MKLDEIALHSGHSALSLTDSICPVNSAHFPAATYRYSLPRRRPGAEALSNQPRRAQESVVTAVGPGGGWHQLRITDGRGRRAPPPALSPLNLLQMQVHCALEGKGLWG